MTDNANDREWHDDADRPWNAKGVRFKINREAFAKLAENPMVWGTVDEIAEKICEKANKAATVEREWYDVDADWDASGYASTALMKLGETPEWLDLVTEASKSTHATADEVWDGMARALVDYLEGLR